MVVSSRTVAIARLSLSVLALSSRFDGQLAAARRRNRRHLSVLALSSRFDGLGDCTTRQPPGTSFSTRSVESF